MTVETSVQVWREGNQYVAHAMPIDIASSGPTPDAARTAVDEAVRLFVRTAADAGTLDEVMEECGYELHDGAWTSPQVLSVERRRTAVVA